MTIFGWDASDFDHDRGPMDMAAARRDGIDFYTHKATESTTTKHHPGPSLAAARAAGIPFLGCYMVPRTPGPSVAAQVSYFLAWVDQQAPWWRTFPGWFFQMDTEHWGYDNVPASIGHQAAQLIAQRTGKTVLHYAPRWAYNNTVPPGEHLWASSYVTGSGPYRQLYPGDTSARWIAYSGRTPMILQYTSSAIIGRQPSCDANAFRGTVLDFARLIGVQHMISKGGPFMALTDEQQQDLWNWMALLVDPGTPPGGRPADRFHFPPTLFQMSAKIDGLVASGNAMRAAIEALTAAINAGGGSVDSAFIVTHMNELAAAELARDNALKAENADLRARLAAALVAPPAPTAGPGSE